MEKLLRLDSLVLGKPETTPEGFLKVPCAVTRPGIFEYRTANGGIRRELRRPEQVFRADSMASLQQKPFVNEHPYHLDGIVSADNVRSARMRGLSGAPAYKSEGHLWVDLFIYDAAAIKEAKAGKVAVSAGYKCDTLEEPGIWEGQPYDAEQVNIVYNHIAQVKKARAGAGAKLRLDEALNELPTPEETDMTVKIKLDDGREIEVSEDVAAAFKAAKTRQDELTTQLATEKGAKEALQTKLDSETSEDEQVRLDAFIRDAVKTRTALITVAQGILPKKDQVKLDEMENAEIMVACIRADAGDPELKLDEADEAYIQGRFDQVVTLRAKAPAKKGTDLGTRINQGRADDAAEEDGDDKGAMTPEQMREKKKEALTNRYKQPIRGKK